MCHALEGNLAAPPLGDLIGLKAGSQSFPYSEAFLKADFVWNEDTLEAFLSKPRELVPNNQMVFNGIESEEERRQLVAFLSEISK